MASSNRHWPSMFKSKPCNNHHHNQWQHEIISAACQKQPYSSTVNCEERSPEPKPRWNPKPEQIRILEAIFNSGMVNPPRDEIRRIRAQLQEYGQVGDANVFYWFQNRKSRSKHKQRNLNTPKATQQPISPNTPTPNVNLLINPKNTNMTTTITTTTTPVSSPSSDKSTSTAFHMSNLTDHRVDSPAISSAAGGGVGSTSTNMSTDTSFISASLVANPFNGCFQQAAAALPTYFPDPAPFIFYNPNFTNFTSQAISELAGINMLQLQEYVKQDTTHVDKVMISNVVSGDPNSEINGCVVNPIVQDLGNSGMNSVKLIMVFINDLAFEVAEVPLNIRVAFGEDAVLLHSTGLPVLTDEFGITLQPLQNGGYYYLV